MRRTCTNGLTALDKDDFAGGFNKQNLKALRPLLESALADIEEQIGVKIELGSFRFNDAQFTTRMTVKSPGRAKDSAEQEFKLMANCYGLKPEWFGKSFKKGSKVFTIIALDMKKRKYPVICSCADGKQYKLPAEDVALVMTNQSKMLSEVVRSAGTN